MLVHDSPRLDHETGEVLEHDDGNVQKLTNENRYLQTELDAAQDEITKLLVQVKALKTKNENRRLTHKRREIIETVHKSWQEILDRKRCALTDDRFDAINSCLNHYAPTAKKADDPELLKAVEMIRVACLGAKHNHPWPQDRRGPMVEIAVICRGSFVEAFHDAGCDWLAQFGHPHPRKFSGPSANLAKVALEFQKANQTLIPHPDGKHAHGVCPVCVQELTVTDGTPKATVVCPSGCDVELIKAALRVKQGQRRRNR